MNQPSVQFSSLFSKFLVSGSLILASFGVAGAATIVGNMNGLSAYFPYDLEETDGVDGSPTTSTDHWAIFGQLDGSTNNSDILVTTKTDSSPFSAASRSGIYGGTYYNLGGRIKFNHDGGFDIDDDPVAAVSGSGSSADLRGAQAQGLAANLPTVSFTYTMQGVEEEFRIYLFTSSSAQRSVDLSATMSSSGGSYTATDIALPSVLNGSPDGGILSLSISGATVGETLTFSISTDYSEEISEGDTINQNWGVGIGGATSTVTAVPEPSSFAFFAGLVGIGLVARRRR